MFSKRKSSRVDETVPRRRRTPQDEADLPRAVSTGEASTSGGAYRRNQTLSSYRHEAADESSRQKTHALVSQRRRVGGVFSIAVAAVVLLGLILWQLIAQVQVTSSSKQLSRSFDQSPYSKAIDQYLSIHPAQRLRFALEEKALSSFVSSQLGEVDRVELSGAPGVAKGGFSITFREPVAGWQINGKQYYVDASGVVFEKNYYPSPTVQIVDESGVSPEQGSTVTGSRLLAFLGRIVSQAQGRGYTVTNAILPQDTTRQIDVLFEGIPTRFKFATDRGAGEQVEDADRSYRFLQARGVTPQYIDVRVSGKAAYR